jgi:hypothetical protein
MKNSNRLHKKKDDNGFQCAHCHMFVSSDPTIAGVRNRNHCPYCLWSRHVDLFEAGDRLAPCQGLMQPIGITLKRTRKKYGLSQYGELMLIHRCVECGRLSINRIAADDDATLVMEIYRSSYLLDKELRDELTASGVNALGKDEEKIVHAQLFGKQQVS